MLAIDATTLHPSTRLALSAITWLEERIEPGQVLEIGCGNGILSLTAAHIWNAQVLACDISENAVADMAANIQEYGADSDISVLRSDGFKNKRIHENAPYDLIIANLLAQWQVGMALEFKKHLSPTGTLLLSGIMAWQEEGVNHALAAINMQVIHKITEQEWQCYIACHTGQPPL